MGEGRGRESKGGKGGAEISTLLTFFFFLPLHFCKLSKGLEGACRGRWKDVALYGTTDKEKTITMMMIMMMMRRRRTRRQKAGSGLWAWEIFCALFVLLFFIFFFARFHVEVARGRSFDRSKVIIRCFVSITSSLDHRHHHRLHHHQCSSFFSSHA